MSDEYGLRNDVDRFKDFLDELEYALQSKYGLSLSDLSTALNRYYDASQIDNLLYEKADTEHTHQDINTQITSIQNALQNTAPLNHEHNEWVGHKLNSYVSLYVNESLRLCEVKFSRQFGSATANTYYVWDRNIIPVKYRPIGNVFGAMSYGGILRVLADGSIAGYFTRSMSSKFTLLGSALWWYPLSNTVSLVWYNHGDRLNVEESGTTQFLINEGSSNGFYLYNKTGTTATNLTELEDWGPSFTVEFDLIEYSGTVYFQIYGGSHNDTINLSEFDTGDVAHIKVVATSSSTKFYVDNNELTNLQNNTTVSKVRVGFRVDVGGALMFSDFTIR